MPITLSTIPPRTAWQAVGSFLLFVPFVALLAAGADWPWLLIVGTLAVFAFVACWPTSQGHPDDAPVILDTPQDQGEPHTGVWPWMEPPDQYPLCTTDFPPPQTLAEAVRRAWAVFGPLGATRASPWAFLLPYAEMLAVQRAERILEQRVGKPRLWTPKRACHYFRTKLALLENEEMWAVYYESIDAECVGIQLIGQGRREIRDGSHALRIITSSALRMGAKAVLIIHNHPGGDPTPGPNDLHFEETCMRALGGLGIHVRSMVVASEGISPWKCPELWPFE